MILADNSPSEIKRDKNWPLPKEMSKKEIKKVLNDFKNTSLLANKIGFDCLEIHMAHGYLLHQFFLRFLIRERTLWRIA